MITNLGLDISSNIFSGKNKVLGSHNHDSLRTIFNLTVDFITENNLEDKYRAEDIVRYFLILSRGVLLEWTVKDGSFDPRRKMHTVIQIGIDAVKSGKYDFL